MSQDNQTQESEMNCNEETQEQVVKDSTVQTPGSELERSEEPQEQVHTAESQTKSCKNGMKRYPCNFCHKTYVFYSNVKRHIQKRHPEHYCRKQRKEKIYSCDFCKKPFATSRTLWHHLKIKHNVSRIPKVPNNARKYACDICGSSFTTTSSLRRHSNNIHKMATSRKYNRRIQCSECQYVLRKKSTYLDHIKTVHDISVNVETLRFENEADFKSWKSDVEKKTVSYFGVDSYYKKRNAFSVYTCHRSGYFVSKSTGKRRLKAGGSFKIDAFCPASISVRGINPGKLFPAEVNFVSSHVGHVCEIQKLRIKQRQNCQKVTDDIVSGLVDKLEEFPSEVQTSEIDRAIAMLVAMKNKKEPNTNIVPQKKPSKRQKKVTNVLFPELIEDVHVFPQHTASDFHFL